jgi:hypothetical protein
MNRDLYPYFISEQRELTPVEKELLAFLLSKANLPGVSANALVVVARCGCGTCPTILFGESFCDDPISSEDSSSVVDLVGRAVNGTLVGVVLFATKEGKVTELEGWSVDGGEIEWPATSVLEEHPGG